MTMDRTLKPHGRLMGSRAVLSRSERIAKLIDEGKFDPATDSPLGLPKVRVRHSKAGTKTKKAAAELALGTEGAVVAAGGAAPAGGEAAKGAAAPAKGAPPAAKGAAAPSKGAAPAAKGEAKGAAKAPDKKK
ncbi:MAG: small basic protein [Phycisphaerae bacterium]|nr:small basic protein [Phycisphaerae bacterium]